MFGISEPHNLNTSGVQAARCSSVPRAKLVVVYKIVASAKSSPQRTPKWAIFEVSFITSSINEL
jgi:hypothetical protein